MKEIFIGTAKAWLEKQGEQKPTDKAEPKFKVGDIIRHKEQGFTCKIIAVDTEYRLSGCNGNHLPFDSQDAYELVEQKPAWSEEDKKYENIIVSILNNPSSESMYNFHEVKRKDVIDWLKSLKDRVQPQQEWKQENTSDLTDFENAMMHIGGSFFGENAGLDPNDTNAIKEQANLLLELVPKQEWSEEDKEMLDFAIRAIGLCRQYAINNQINGYSKLPDVPKKFEELQNWLKSKLCPQPHWKPSDEQMNALQYVYRNCNPLPSDKLGWDSIRTLELMYQDLKKLKG